MGVLWVHACLIEVAASYISQALQRMNFQCRESAISTPHSPMPEEVRVGAHHAVVACNVPQLYSFWLPSNTRSSGSVPSCVPTSYLVSPSARLRLPFRQNQLGIVHAMPSALSAFFIRLPSILCCTDLFRGDQCIRERAPRRSTVCVGVHRDTRTVAVNPGYVADGNASPSIGVQLRSS